MTYRFITVVFIHVVWTLPSVAVKPLNERNFPQRSARSAVDADSLVPFTSASTNADHVDLANNALMRYHASSVAELEQSCYMNNCDFNRAKELIGNEDDASLYWNLLNCAKHGLFCDDQGRWEPWQPWTECAATCGAGQQTRHRKCRQSKYWGSNCEGRYAEKRDCTRVVEMECVPQPAKPDHWASWGSWSKCDVTCGNEGHVTRSRDCLPYHEAYFCLGEVQQRRSCVQVPPCPVNGLWSTWRSWSNCLVPTCGQGVRLRLRECSSPSPSGLGKKCMGPSSEHELCPGQPCPEHLRSAIFYFTEQSHLRYQLRARKSFLSIFIRFRPTTTSGTLLQYEESARVQQPPNKATTNVLVKSKGEEQLDTVGSVLASMLPTGHVTVQASLNGSDLVVIEAGKMRLGEWNTLRITALSDVISVRVNDGASMVATLQDSPLLSTNQSATDWWWSRLVSYVTDALAWISDGGVISGTRAILTSYQGRVSLGQVLKDDFGFRGYVSELLVNFQKIELNVANQSQAILLTNPVTSHDVTILPANQFHRPAEVTLPYFNGKTRIVLPFALKWWNEFREDFVPTKDTKAGDIVRDDAATLELMLMPYGGDGIILWNRGARNLAQHLKLSLEDGTRIKLTFTRGGRVTTIHVDDAIKLRQWNKIVLQFIRNGEVQLEVNGGKTASTKGQAITKKSEPGPVLVVGGGEKNIFRNSSAGVTQRHAQGFHGYIFSVKMNGIEMLTKGRIVRSIRGTLSSDFLSKPLGWRFWHFNPGSDLVWEETSAETQRSFRSLSCTVPVPDGVTTPPEISWYKDGMPVAGQPFFRITIDKGNAQIRSRIHLMATAEDSRVLSGVYSCVLSDTHYHWLIVNHVVSVINYAIAYPRGLSYVIKWTSFQLGTSYPVALVILLGAVCIACLLLLSLCRAIVRLRKGKRPRAKKRRKVKKVNDAAEEEETPLMETREKERPKEKAIDRQPKQPDPSSGFENDELAPSVRLLTLTSDDEIELYDERLFR